MNWRMGYREWILMGTLFASRWQAGLEAAEPTLPLAFQLTNPAAVDQDDLCFWTSAASPINNLIVVSDKGANSLFVYDIQGQVRQSIAVKQPGNIDLRSTFRWRGQTTAIVAVNERATGKLLLFVVHPQTGRLDRVDDGTIDVGDNYGGSLLQVSDRLYFLVTSKTSGARQWELTENGEGRISGREIRKWLLGTCEGAVGDDVQGQFYVSVEAEGIYRLPGRPEANAAAELVLPIGRDGLQGDLEGLVILTPRPDARFLLLSDQGTSRFRIFGLEQGMPHRVSFAISEVARTDGVDFTASSYGELFPRGLLACHSDLEEGRVLRVVDGRELLQLLE